MAVRPTPGFAEAGDIPVPQGIAGTTAPHGPVNLLEESPVRPAGYHMPSSGSARATRARVLSELGRGEDAAGEPPTTRRNLSLEFSRMRTRRIEAVAQDAVRQVGERPASEAPGLRSRASSERS